VRAAIKVGLSTASVYPLRIEAAFDYAARLGYDGVELMVWAESVSTTSPPSASCPAGAGCRCRRTESIGDLADVLPTVTSDQNSR